jgi:hypothetical protein
MRQLIALACRLSARVFKRSVVIERLQEAA